MGSRAGRVLSRGPRGGKRYHQASGGFLELVGAQPRLEVGWSSAEHRGCLRDAGKPDGIVQGSPSTGELEGSLDLMWK